MRYKFSFSIILERKTIDFNFEIWVYFTKDFLKITFRILYKMNLFRSYSEESFVKFKFLEKLLSNCAKFWLNFCARANVRKFVPRRGKFPGNFPERGQFPEKYQGIGWFPEPKFNQNSGFFREFAKISPRLQKFFLKIFPRPWEIYWQTPSKIGISINNFCCIWNILHKISFQIKNQL